MRLRHAASLVCAGLLLTAPPALAGRPGTWTRLGAANLDNIDEAALARTPDGVLHAEWTVPSHNNGGAGDSIVHVAITRAGLPGPVAPIVSGWASTTAVPDLVTLPDGTLRTFFGG